MAITFPRALPDIRFLHARFAVDDPVKASPSVGLINYTRTVDPTWHISFRTPRLTESQLAEIEAWWMSLRTGLRSALVAQNVTCRPKAHASPANAAPAQDAGMLSSVTGNSLSVTSVASSLVLTAGDLIGLEYDGKYGLGRVIEATGAGTSRTIAIEPAPRSYVAVAGAVVRFENPKLIMRPVPGSWTASEGPRPSVSFRMIESML